MRHPATQTSGRTARDGKSRCYAPRDARSIASDAHKFIEVGPFQMQFALLCTAIFFFLVKIVSTIWLVRQPDATTVTTNLRGRGIYYASKLSAILFVAAMLARTCLQDGPPAYIAFWAVLLVAATVMVVVVIRQRAAGEWYGYAHEIKEGRRRPRGR